MRADARRNYIAIVEAARKVFAAHGGQASLESIAEEAGVGIGTLYRRFPKRIDLVEAVYQEDVDGLVRAGQNFAETLSPWDALVAWLEAYVAYANFKRTLINELHEAFEKHPGLKSGARERLQASLSTLLERAQAAGVARTDIDGADLYQLLTPMCVTLSIDEEQRARLLVMVIDGLRPPS